MATSIRQALLAPTGTDNAAWLAVLWVAPCSPGGPQHCPHPGRCRGPETLAATGDPGPEQHHREPVGRGSRGWQLPAFCWAILLERPSRGSCPLRRQSTSRKKDKCVGAAATHPMGHRPTGLAPPDPTLWHSGPAHRYRHRYPNKPPWVSDWLQS